MHTPTRFRATGAEVKLLRPGRGPRHVVRLVRLVNVWGKLISPNLWTAASGRWSSRIVIGDKLDITGNLQLYQGEIAPDAPTPVYTFGTGASVEVRATVPVPPASLEA